MRVHTMFNDVDIVLERVCAIGPVMTTGYIDYDYYFEVWFASMSMKPNPMTFGDMVTGSKSWEESERADKELKEKITNARNELVELLKSL